MKEDQYIESLFEAAREEAPKISFEEVAQQFEAATTPTPIEVIKDLLTNSIHLNTIIMIISVTSIAFIFWINSSTTTETPQAYPIIKTITKQVESLKKETKKEVIISPIVQTASTKIKNPKHKIFSAIKKEQSDTTITISQTPENWIIEEVIDIASINKVQPLKITTHQIVSNTYRGKDFELVADEQEEDLVPTNETLQSEPNLIFKEVLFTLKSTDDQATAIDFGRSLTNLGLAILINPNYNANGTVLRQFTLRIRHEKGLDWKMKVNGFRTLEMKVFLNEKKQVEMLSYRFNQKGKFSKPIKVSYSKIRTKIRGGTEYGKSKYQTRIRKH